ncbi:MAG: flagellar assembly peptidoglycan hydrolase FlgJ [Chloroflexi bacterium]|nr:flagellar assembly peptidoglycan hydrolase FlgJ [Chloroflexota bacterium]
MANGFEKALAGADFGALVGLRAQARRNSPEAARAVAQQFEALFVQTMLQSMREANNFGGLFDSPQTGLYQDLFDKQISADIAKRGDLGFADMLLQQIAPKASGTVDAEALVRFEPRWWQGMHGEPLQTMRQLETSERIAAAVDTSEDDAGPPDAIGDTPAYNPRTFGSREEFVRALAPHAEAAGRKLGLDPDLLLAQAALETGWGKHMIRDGSRGNSFNLFGIKAGASWSGERMRVSTLEYDNGVARRELAPFRAYESYSDSFNDYVDFLQSRPRYSRALENAGDPESYIRALQGAGYATDPRYADKVLSIMNNQIRTLRQARAAGGTENG